MRRYPDSCFAINAKGWYNSLYSELSDFTDCRYQLQINQDLCEEEPPSTLEDVIEIILAFVAGQNRRVARAAIRIICREAIRQNALQTGSEQ